MAELDTETRALMGAMETMLGSEVIVHDRTGRYFGKLVSYDKTGFAVHVGAVNKAFPLDTAVDPAESGRLVPVRVVAPRKRAVK